MLPCAPGASPLASRQLRLSRSRSASAPTPRSSRWWTRFFLLRALPVKEPCGSGAGHLSRFGLRLELGRRERSLSDPMGNIDFRDNNQVFGGMFCRFSYPMHTGYGGRTEKCAAGGDCLGNVFPGSRRHAGGRPSAYARLLQGAGRTSRRCVESRLLDEPFRWRSRRSLSASPWSLNGHPYTVIGVAQAGFEGVELGEPDPDFRSHDDEGAGPHTGVERSRGLPFFLAAGVETGLKPAVSPEQAQAALAAVLPAAGSRWRSRSRRSANVPERGRKRFLDNKLSIIPAAQGRSSSRESMTTPLWGADRDGDRQACC